MNSFSHGDLKALLTKWVTFLGYFHKAGQLLPRQTTFLEFPFRYKGNQRGWNYLEHSVEFWLLSYREMGGDLWQGLCKFAVAHKFRV